MKTFRQFAAEAYVKKGYLPESYDQLDEGIGKVIRDTAGRWFVGGGIPGEFGYDKALEKSNQNKFRDGQKGNKPNDIARNVSSVASSMIPWEKIPGAAWKYVGKPAVELLKWGLTGGGMQNKF
tara:strand:- start:54 stop:422 length:369 start_codon:yes stop_codon:yes gene_type:complete